MANAKVFVRGFDFGTTEAQIRSHCATAGPVRGLEAWGNGAAVVTYSSALGAQKAVATLNGSKIPGNFRFIDVKEDLKSRPGPPPATNFSAANRKRPAPASGAGDGCRVFVRGFDFGTTDEMLLAHVAQAGSVEDVQWKNQGSAIVTYSSAEEAQAAAEHLNGTTIEGNSRYIDVCIDGEGEPRFKAARPGAPMGQMGEMGEMMTLLKMMAETMGLSMPNAGKGGGKGGGKLGSGRGLAPRDPVGSGRVFVRGFDFGTSSEQFEAHMGQVGTVLKVFWAGKGEAAVVYSTRAEAEAAASGLNQTVIAGNRRYMDVILKDSE